jgi:hypothetical protein
MKQLFWIAVIIWGAASDASAQTVSFNFSDASHPVSGWINVYGDPSSAVRTATDPTTGIAISSVATANWAPDVGSASDGGGATNGTFFPAAVMINHWFQYGTSTGAYNALMPQLIISNLNADSVYTIKMTGSFDYEVPNDFNLNPIRYTVAGAVVYGYIDIDGDSNAASGATFQNIAPDSTGKIRVYVNTFGGSNTGSICGLQVITGHTAVTAPTVMLTSPLTGTQFFESNNITLSATASVTTGAIDRVVFYANGTIIGTDSSAPYSMAWIPPDPGSYTITAKAIDDIGDSSTSSANVVVESTNYFWSTTGNIATGGDTSFVGTVDSNRLAIRTKNIERMSILPTGNIGIGTISPTAQFHTTGTVRLAGLTNDSTKTRVLVSDTSGNLYYRSASSLTGRWQYANGTVYDSADNIAIGTNNPQGYKLAVNGTAIFTKAKVKTAGTWPDYVFEKAYQLPNLKDLEQYLLTHHHLPEIPDQRAVSQDGIDLSEHAAALLKKVEELTLYAIQQDKQLTEQGKQLAEQNARLEAQQKEIDALKALITDKKN